MTQLEKITEKLLKVFEGKNGPEVQLLSKDQMLIRKNIVPNPAANSGLKIKAFLPGANGYEIYLACRAPTTSDTRPPQRGDLPSQPITWDSSSMTLCMSRGSQSAYWKIMNHDGQEISISVDCGSEIMFEEVDRILAVVAETLL